MLPEGRSPPIDVLLVYRVGASRILRVAAVLEEARLAVLRVLEPQARTPGRLSVL